MDETLRLLLEARGAAQTGDARRLRLAAGLAQTEVARSLGVAPSCLSRWESGRRRPTGDAAIRWAWLLRDLARHANGDTSPQAAAVEELAHN